MLQVPPPLFFCCCCFLIIDDNDAEGIETILVEIESVDGAIEDGEQEVEVDIIDPTQFDPNSQYYDPKSTPETPRWQTVKVEFKQRFAKVITLAQLKQEFTPDDLLLVRRGNRLSVMPVAEDIARQIMAKR